MESEDIVIALGALAQKSRLAVFRWLVQAGPSGGHPGEIAATLGIAPATLSFQLKCLTHAGLVDSETKGRFIRYRANFRTVRSVIDYLTENCCAGVPGVAACGASDLVAREGECMKRVLFVCVENANRSQMAEAFARMYGGVEAQSAGSRPSGVINPKAIRFMRELDYDLAQHSSKSLAQIEGEFDAVITMGCGDQCPWIPAKRLEDWALPDPKHMDDDAYRQVRDDIGRRVKALLDSL